MSISKDKLKNYKLGDQFSTAEDVETFVNEFPLEKKDLGGSVPLSALGLIKLNATFEDVTEQDPITFWVISSIN